jgi:hypothetical protein
MKPNVQRIFSPNPIQNLEDNDFELSGSIKIMLKIKRCLIVLFYTDNTESNNVADIWQEVGQQGVGNVFAACNLRINQKIADAFNELNMKNTSLHWAALKTVPFILVYQNGYPIGFYNGDRAVQPILDFSMTLACRSDYREPVNLYGGIQSEDNMGIEGNEQYGSSENPFRKQSLDFKAGKPVRTYNKEDRPKTVTSELQSSLASGIGSGIPTSEPETTSEPGSTSEIPTSSPTSPTSPTRPTSETPSETRFQAPAVSEGGENISI